MVLDEIAPEDARYVLQWLTQSKAPENIVGLQRHVTASIDAITRRVQAIESEGLSLGQKDGWRDDEGYEWYLWLGEMVECPRCAFMFSSVHRDQGSGIAYTCPSCKQDEIEMEIRNALDAVIVSHGVGEMSELLAGLLALVTGGASVGR